MTEENSYAKWHQERARFERLMALYQIDLKWVTAEMVRDEPYRGFDVKRMLREQTAYRRRSAEINKTAGIITERKLRACEALGLETTRLFCSAMKGQEEATAKAAAFTRDTDALSGLVSLSSSLSSLKATLQGLKKTEGKSAAAKNFLPAASVDGIYTVLAMAELIEGPRTKVSGFVEALGAYARTSRVAMKNSPNDLLISSFALGAVLGGQKALKEIGAFGEDNPKDTALLLSLEPVLDATLRRLAPEVRKAKLRQELSCAAFKDAVFAVLPEEAQRDPQLRALVTETSPLMTTERLFNPKAMALLRKAAGLPALVEVPVKEPKRTPELKVRVAQGWRKLKAVALGM